MGRESSGSGFDRWRCRAQTLAIEKHFAVSEISGVVGLEDVFVIKQLACAALGKTCHWSMRILDAVPLSAQF